MPFYYLLGDMEYCDHFWNHYWDYLPREKESDDLKGLDYGMDGRRFDY